MRGINALLAAVKTTASAPVVVGQRLRKVSCGSPRGAARLIGDALATLKRVPDMAGARVLVRADSAYYGFAAVNAALTTGADVSITARMDPAVKRAIATIPDDGWETIKYPDAIYDEDTERWISKAEVAEVPFTAFASRKKSERVTGRLVVRRIPELNKKNLEHPTLFDTHRFHAFFTTSTLDTVEADKTHRQHAVIEQVHADLNNSALAHLPSGVFTANAAWLVPARIANSARHIRLHLPENWPWATEWAKLFAIAAAPPPSDHSAENGAIRNAQWNNQTTEVWRATLPSQRPSPSSQNQILTQSASVDQG